MHDMSDWTDMPNTTSSLVRFPVYNDFLDIQPLHPANRPLPQIPVKTVSERSARIIHVDGKSTIVIT